MKPELIEERTGKTKNIDEEKKTLQSVGERYESFEETPLIIAVLTYVSYAILIVFGHFRDCLRRRGIGKVPVAAEPVSPVSAIITFLMLHCHGNRRDSALVLPVP